MYRAVYCQTLTASATGASAERDNLLVLAAANGESKKKAGKNAYMSYM